VRKLGIRRSLEILTVILALGITTNTTSNYEHNPDNITQQRQEYHERQEIKKAERLYWPRLQVTSKIHRTAIC